MVEYLWNEIYSIAFLSVYHISPGFPQIIDLIPVLSDSILQPSLQLLCLFGVDIINHSYQLYFHKLCFVLESQGIPLISY